LEVCDIPNAGGSRTPQADASVRTGLEGGALLLERPDEKDEEDQERMAETHLQNLNANAKFREVARFLESIRYLHLVPNFCATRILPGSWSVRRSVRPEFPGSGRQDARKDPKTPLERIEAALREAVPQLKNLTDTKDEQAFLIWKLYMSIGARTPGVNGKTSFRTARCGDWPVLVAPRRRLAAPS